ncbi:MAG: hypothetical protein ACPGYV_06790, partial [Phycisphaeraceae bacterium]
VNVSSVAHWIGRMDFDNLRAERGYDASRAYACSKLCNLLFTREAWYRAGGYPEDVGALDAWGFGLRLVATGSSLQVCPNATYDHRIGHDSYWQREVQPGKTDRLALGVLRPYLHRLEPQSQLYLLQGENQERWFTQLAERPLRVEGEAKPRRRPSINLNLGGLRQRLSRLVSRAA